MWKKITNPDVLVFLMVSYQVSMLRRNLNWTISEYQEQLFRLRHAGEHADLIIDTNNFSPDEIETIVISYLIENGKLNPIELQE